MKPRATFTSDRRDRFIIIRDQGDVYTGTTVAADAATIVPHCLKQHGNYRLIYRNVDGNWRDLRHDGKRFLEIADIGADELEEILELSGLEF